MERRRHIVLVPGFGGFDALGSLKYYTGITELLREGTGDFAGATYQAPLSVHYFPNLPTASVVTRARALRNWLVKWFQRGIIRPGDSSGPGDLVHLIGHSTGGNDIKQLMFDLYVAVTKNENLFGIPAERIRDSLSSIQFLSTPHYGTSFAHQVRRRKWPITAAMAFLYETNRALRGSLTSGLAHGVARIFRPSSLLRAVVESVESFDAPRDNPLARAEAQGNYFEGLRWLHQISTDFGAIADLDPYGVEQAVIPDEVWNAVAEDLTENAAVGQSVLVDRALPTLTDPLLFSSKAPEAALPLPKLPGLQKALADVYVRRNVALRSIVTVAEAAYGAPTFDPFRVAHGLTAQQLPEPTTPYENLRKTQLDKRYSLQTLESKVAGGPPDTVSIGPADNDGIVNSVSMVWPDLERSFLVRSDHGDIIGHYIDRAAVDVGNHTQYDLLRSASGFNEARFRMVWKSVLKFALDSEEMHP